MQYLDCSKTTTDETGRSAVDAYLVLDSLSQFCGCCNRQRSHFIASKLTPATKTTKHPRSMSGIEKMRCLGRYYWVKWLFP